MKGYFMKVSKSASQSASAPYQAMEYRDGEFKKADLRRGHFYITNDNRVLMYLGIDKAYGKFNFYEITGCLPNERLMREEYYDALHKCDYSERENIKEYLPLVHHNMQVDSIKDMIESIFKESVEKSSILQYKGVPRIVAEFHYVEKEKELDNWYLSDKNKDSNLPALVNPDKDKMPSVYVSAKDLKPGHLYYTGSLWRGLYCYLGRDNANNFCWAFIGNTRIFIKESINYWHIDRTKSNKKVKPIEYATQDPDACIYDEIKPFLDGSFCKDLSDLNLNSGFRFAIREDYER